MTFPSNILQQVQTYQKASLAYLQNLCPFVKNANTKFKNFQDVPANLGSSVTFDLTYRFAAANGLVADFQSIEQRVQTLTNDQAGNVSMTVSDPQTIFNFNDKYYMEQIGYGAMAEMATKVESNFALNVVSAVPVNNIVGSTFVPTGALHTESGPYRFFGDGVTAINSFTQLAEMIALYKSYGAAKNDIKVFLPNTIVPQVVGTGLGQFAPRRNDEIAQSWEIGQFGAPAVSYYESNLLPIHQAGTVGSQASSGARTLTVVSTNDPTGANITQITFSGAPSNNDPSAILSGDLFQFNFGVSGQPDMYFLTFIGHVPSPNPVQFRATANAASDNSGNVIVNITPALSSTPGKNQNLQHNVVAGMQVGVIPSHRAGLVIGGNAMYISLPRLPDQNPFATSNEFDKETGVSLRMYYGAIFGQSTQGLIHDVTWGSTIVPEYSMRIIFPVNQ